MRDQDVQEPYTCSNKEQLFLESLLLLRKQIRTMGGKHFQSLKGTGNLCLPALQLNPATLSRFLAPQ